jgi:DNA-binding Lrp family transcriptional regulator
VPKGVLVYLNVFVESKELERVTEALSKIPEVTEVYEVTGEYDLVAVIKSDTINQFRQVLKDKILKVRGIRSTVSSVVLHVHKKDGKLVSD